MVRFVDDGADPASEPPGDGVAPVIPLFGDARGTAADADWHTTWRGEQAPSRSGASHPRVGQERSASDAASEDLARLDAEKALLNRLRTRQLSEAEARRLLVERDLAEDQIADVIASFVARGYLDDARLAEQLAYAGAQKRGQGRRAIAQTMMQRGVPRDVADAALAEMPDDETERALEYARKKAPSLASVEPDAALRRLVGQLSRRGYGGSLAMDAAKTALAEV